MALTLSANRDHYPLLVVGYQAGPLAPVVLQHHPDVGVARWAAVPVRRNGLAPNVDTIEPDAPTKDSPRLQVPEQDAKGVTGWVDDTRLRLAGVSFRAGPAFYAAPHSTATDNLLCYLHLVGPIAELATIRKQFRGYRVPWIRLESPDVSKERATYQLDVGGATSNKATGAKTAWYSGANADLAGDEVNGPWVAESVAPLAGRAGAGSLKLYHRPMVYPMRTGENVARAAAFGTHAWSDWFTISTDDTIVAWFNRAQRRTGAAPLNRTAVQNWLMLGALDRLSPVPVPMSPAFGRRLRAHRLSVDAAMRRLAVVEPYGPRYCALRQYKRDAPHRLPYGGLPWYTRCVTGGFAATKDWEVYTFHPQLLELEADDSCDTGLAVWQAHARASL